MPTSPKPRDSLPAGPVGAVRVSLADLDDLIADMRSFGDQGVAIGLDLDGSVRQLHGHWDGAAAAAHGAAAAAWRHHHREALAVLGAARQCLQVVRQNYEAAVSANLAMWR